MACKYCKGDEITPWTLLTELFDDSDINVTLHNKGKIRAVYLADDEKDNDEVTIEINYCPICGARLKGE